MPETPIAVLLAVTSPLLRRVVSAALNRADGLLLVGETDQSAAVAALAATLHPDVILCDELLAPHAVQPTAPSHKPAEKRSLVVVVTTAIATSPAPASGIAAILPLNVPARDWYGRLAEALTAAVPPRPTLAPLPDMEDRFMIAGPPLAPKPKQPEQDMPSSPAVPRGSLNRFHNLSDLAPPGARTRSLERRAHPQAHTALLRAARGQAPAARDATTGLAGAQSLDLALLELPRLQLPAAVVVVGVHFSQPLLERATAAPALRQISAVLRANVRLGDPVCFLDPMGFAVVLLTVDEGSIVGPLQRIRKALQEVQLLMVRGAAARASLGTGFWKPGTAVQQPVRSAWHAMLQDRDSRP